MRILLEGAIETPRCVGPRIHQATGLTGIVLTKLDSTAKGGIVFAIEHSLGVPVRFVGVGEKVGDLLPFGPDDFVAALFG